MREYFAALSLTLDVRVAKPKNQETMEPESLAVCNDWMLRVGGPLTTRDTNDARHPSDRPPSISRPKDIGIVLLNGLGDCLLAVPVIRAIQATGFGLTIAIPPHPKYDDVLLELRSSASHVTAEPRYTESRWEFDVSELVQLFKGCCKVILMIDWDSLQVRELRRRLLELGTPTYAHRFPQSLTRTDGRIIHQLDLNRQLATEAIGHELHPVRLPSECQDISRLPIISVHPETARERTYEIDEWVAVIDDIGRTLTRYRVFLHGQGYAAKIARHCTSDVVPVLGKISTALRVASRSSALLTIDSYLLPYTDLIGVPSVALFRSNDPARWGPYFTRQSSVYRLQQLNDVATRRMLVDRLAGFVHAQ